MVKGRTITFKYKHINYDDNIKKLLTVNLTPKEEQELNSIYNHYNSLQVHRGYEFVIKDLYILVIKRNISTSDLAGIYDVGIRTIQLWLKELGLNRTLKEAKQISAAKEKITNDSFLDTPLMESEADNFIKCQLNTLLIQKLKEYEVIVGISALGITNIESDIPVIIIKGSHIYKFIVQTEEVTKNKEKTKIYYSKGYKLLRMDTRKNYKEEYLNYKFDLENILKNLVSKIIKEMKGF